MSDDTADTIPPPPPDPLMAIAERLEQKIDTLTSIATACFERTQLHDREIADLRTEVEFLKRKGSQPPVNGHVDG